MNCDERNKLFLAGETSHDDLWPKVKEYRSRRYQFQWEFGLDVLPEAPGLITIRGPRQYGKSTWLEFKLLETLEKYGKGTGFILNGDEIYSHGEFEAKLTELEASFSKKTKVKRLFIDEITSIEGWEKVLKRILDQGRLRDVLIVTTGSNAADLRHGSERLPGRKGSLPRNDYVFLPISYKEFLSVTRNELGKSSKDRLLTYILSGGSPLAIHELAQDNQLTDTFTNLIKDWLIGDIVSSGRSRIFLLNVLRRLFEHGASTISYTKLAREAGLANNTAALDYIEKLSDIFCVLPAMQWDHVKQVQLARKPSKIHFINLSVVMAFHPNSIRNLNELKELAEREQAALYEWAVAQELWRSLNLRNQKENRSYSVAEEIAYWSSEKHEIDFVIGGKEFYEVKAGTASALEFAWFEKIFPGKKLTVISESSFDSRSVKGLSLEQFLLSSHPSK